MRVVRGAGAFGAAGRGVLNSYDERRPARAPNAAGTSYLRHAAAAAPTGGAMRVIAYLLITLSMALGGCANFKVVTDFAQATKQVTAPVRDRKSVV